jgi:hypothetical protein
MIKIKTYCLFTCLALIITKANATNIIYHLYKSNFAISKLSENNYNLYVHSFFSLGSGTGTCPIINDSMIYSSNDTLYVKNVYITNGIWTTSFCNRFDTTENIITTQNINYITAITNEITSYTDTFGLSVNVFRFDSTFVINQFLSSGFAPNSDNMFYNNELLKRLEFKSKKKSDYSIQVFTINGQLVSKHTVLNSLYTTIDIALLSKGVYIVKCFDILHNNNIVEKFVVK